MQPVIASQATPSAPPTRFQETIRVWCIVPTAIALLGLLSSATVNAQTQQQSRERDAVRRAQAALQKSEQEKVRLLEEKAGLEKDRAELTKKLSASTGAQRLLAAARKKAAEQAQIQEQLQRQLDASTTKGTQSAAKADALSARLTAAEEQGRRLEAQVKTLEQQLAQQREIIGRQSLGAQACNEKNAKLYTLTHELMDRYQRKGVWDAVLQREPFTGLKSVEIENVLSDMQDRAGAARLGAAPGAQQSGER